MHESIWNTLNCSRICRIFSSAVLQFVNQNLGWKLPEHASGAINLWFDDKDVMIDVETSDGGVSTISYTKFLEKLEEGKNEDPNYKLSKDDFCDCFC